VEIAASAAIIIIIASTLLPSVVNSRVLGTNIARETSINDSLVATDVVNTDDTDSNRLDAMQEARDALEASRAARKAAIDEARAEFRAARKAAIDEARAEFRENLTAIRDAQKRRILEHLGDRLEQINERWTGHFDNVLARLSEILVKIGTRADKLEVDGRDVASVRDAITDAEAAIDTAQDLVNSQAGNSYIIDITDEENLKDDVKSVRDKLHEDLTAARSAVKTAREAVHNAFQALKDVRSQEDSENGGINGG